MSYTFGGATSDRVNTTRSTTGGNCVWLFAGWFKPTSLTAGRGLMGFGTGGLTGIKIGTTTSELVINVDYATTDAVFTTSGLGLVVDVWQFIAVMQAASSSGVGACKVWTGTIGTPPHEVTVTVTTGPAGGFVTSNIFTVGNLGSTATVAFQGMIEQCILIAQTGPGNTGSLPIAANGVIAQNEADLVFADMVVPFWRGEPALGFGHQPATGLVDLTLWDLATNPATLDIKTLGGVALGPVNPTITGATFNEERSGARIMTIWPCSPHFFPTIRR